MPSRGRYRGGRGGSSSSSGTSSPHFRAFQGAGNVLGGDAHTPSQTGQGAAYWARGFGRAGELTVQGQNAVGFDYSNLRPKHRGIGTGATSSTGTSSPRGSGSGAASPAPPPPPPHEGVPNTFNKSPFAKGRKVREPDYPAYYTSRGHDAASRAPETSGDDRYLAGIRRGPAQQLRNKKPGTSGWRSGDPAERAAMFAPVAFVKATGEWKDGKWTGKNTSDTHSAQDGTQQQKYDDISARPSGAGLGFSKAANTDSTPKTAQAQSHDEEADEVAALLAQFPGSRELFDPTETSFADDPLAQPSWSMEFAGTHASQQQSHSQAQHKHEQEPVVASSALELVDGQGSADVEETATDAMDTAGTEQPMQATTAPTASAAGEQAPASLPRNRDSSDDEEEEILVPYNRAQSQGQQAEITTTQSDSEEERQLDAIIAEAGQQADPQLVPPSQSAQPAFVFDFTGDDSAETAATEAAIATATTSFVLGDESKPATDAADVSEALEQTAAEGGDSFANIIVDSSDDEGGFVPVSGQGRQQMRKGTGRKARNAAKKARRRAKKFGYREGADTSDAAPAGKPERLEPRMGDSDLEWGSDGPPEMGRKANHGIDPAAFQLRELSLSAQADAPRNRADEERMLQEALAISASQQGPGAAPARGVQYSSISVKAQSKGKGPRSRRQIEQDAIMADYLENALRQPHDSESEVLSEGADEARLGEPTDMDAMLKFMQGMDPNGAGRQMTLGDIEDEQRMMEEEAWMTESDDDEDGADKDDGDAQSDSEGGWGTTTKEKKTRAGKAGKSDDADAQMEAALDKSERQEIGESDGESSSSGSGEAEDSDEDSDGDDDDDEAAYEDTYEDVDESSDDDIDDSEEDEGRIFDRKFTWAAEDEGIINKIERFAAANHDVLTGRDRKARNRLFKSIETGEFDTFGGPDDFIDPEEMMGLVPAKKKKGKKGGKAPQFSSDDIFGDELQLQWEKDRATKAENKRKRAELRRAAAANPFPNTHKKGTKKMAKKATRAERRAGRVVRGDDAPDEWDESTPPLSRAAARLRNSSGSLTPYDYSGSGSASGAGGLAPELTRHATNLSQVNKQILAFLDEDSHGTLALPPMDKRSRAQVHMLASAYSLVSKSRGAGRARFITFIKNKHSGRRVDTRKVSSILAGRGEASFGAVAGSAKGKLKLKSGSSSGGAGGGGGFSVGGFVPPNKDGAAVGWGADRIGADNIGHRLLMQMGWAEGSGVGANQDGMAEPVGATIKTSKGGLGF